MSIELRASDAVVSLFPEDGGRIGQIEADGQGLLRGPEHAAAGWGRWGSYPLVPWSNRIPGGTFVFEGRQLAVPVNWEDGSAIHGLGASSPWRIDAHSAERAQLAIEVSEGPYAIEARQALHLTAAYLDQTLEVINRGSQRVPVGLGIHPWFRAGPISVPADLCWPGQGPLPEGEPVAVGPDEDLRTTRVPPLMDRCYTGLTGTSAEVPGMRLHWSGPITQVVVASGEPGWVCVEPVTMANNGFQLAADGVAGAGIIALDPGEGAAVGYRFDWAGR